MSKTTGTADQILSLPKGGGAVQGLGATFETDLNTGTGSYSIPISLPSGPNAIKPEIAIRYHSAAGNGPFGIGWTLGALTIARKTEGRIPNYSPGDKEFVLVGAEDLIPVGSGRYRPRVDTMHWRIERRGDGWELTNTQGMRHHLGQDAQARVETTEGGLSKTAQWLLEEMSDTNGNAVKYSYLRVGPQRYLEKVEWGTYVLKLTYEARPDRLSNCRYGFLLETSLRCALIELHVTTVEPSLVRSWKLEYEQAAGSSLSLLHRVTLRGHAADGSTLEAPPLTLDYTRFSPTTLERFSNKAPGTVPASFATGRLEIIDWDGDGLPDLLELISGRARVWPNLGRGRFGPPQSLASLPFPVALDEPGVAFADMEGNGTADLIMLDRPLAGYYPHRPKGGFARPVFWRQTPAARLSSSTARLVDLNGDGVVDLLDTNDSFFTLYYRNPGDGWRAPPQTVPRSQAPPVSLADPRVRLADMNGDGLQDLVRVDGAGLVYWPYLGNGRWAEKASVSNPPDLPRQFDPRRLFVADIDGDGCADLVYVAFDHVVYWLNQGGVRLSDPVKILYTPPATMNEIRIADMKGTGTAGIVWSSLGTTRSRAGYLYLDFSGGNKPYLLTGINNGLGLETHIRYRTSTEFALDDAAAGKRWHTFHPFPLQCVAETELHDTVTGQSAISRNRYHEGRYDGQSRTFLGFGVVDAETVGDDSIPTLLTRNTYHLGLDPSDLERPLNDDERQRLGALRRRLLRTEIYGLDGSAEQEKPFQIVQHEYEVRVESASDGREVFVAFETRTLDEQFERDEKPFAFREVLYQNFDEHGNILKQRLRAWRADAPQTPDQDIITEVTFAINLDAHVVSLRARSTQRAANGNVVGVTVDLYDGPPHEGLPEGQLNAGNLTRQEILVVPDELAARVYGAAQPDWQALNYHRRAGEEGWWITQVSHERQATATNLALVSRGPRGFETRLEYDATRQYPQRVTDALGNVMEGTMDERVFQMTSVTDANGQKVIDLYDSLGRVTAIIKPGDENSSPSTVLAYRTDSLPTRVESHLRERNDSGDTLDHYRYFNGRGEFIQGIAEGEGDRGRRFIVTEAPKYSTRGQVSARYLPYFVESQEYAPPPPNHPRLRMRYDALGRKLEDAKASGARLTQTFVAGSVVTRDEVDNASAVPTPIVHRLDSLKRILAVENHLTDRVVAAHFEYDEVGQLIRVRPPDGGESRLTYDLVGHVLLEETPDTGRTSYIYDAAGNQVQRTTQLGKTVRSTFDGLNRMVESRDDGAAAPEVAFTYVDANSPEPPDGLRNRRGRLWRIQDRLGTLTYAYDERGQISQVRRSVSALGGREFVTDILYDALGRQTRIVLPETRPGAGRRTVEYRYNARGLPASSPNHVRSAEYDVQGHLTRLVYQNGVENILDFDMITGRPRRMRVMGADARTLRDQTFSFDGVGNLLRIDAALTSETGRFTYDDLYRLTAANYGSGERFAYQYSDGGNITQIEGVGSLSYGGAAGSGAVTAAGDEAYAYDTDGNLSSAPFGTPHFDGFDNLVRWDLPDGRVMDCTYDYKGQRVVKRVSGEGGAEVICADSNLEYHNGQPLLWVTFGGKRILGISNSGDVFLHADMPGTPTLFTGINGEEIRRVVFGPYGSLRSDSAGGAGLPDAIRFTGQPGDTETGLICLGRRYYDPRLGRFISADRAVGGVYRADSWNRYVYARNNPLRYTDASGLFSIGDLFSIIGIAIATAALVVAGAFTAGSTWSLAGLMSTALYGAAAGMGTGAVFGGATALAAGGDLWKGVLFGGFVGGVAGFVGGMFGNYVTTALAELGVDFFDLIAGGAIQGAFAGVGTGAAIGFAGGKGTAENFWTNIAKGAFIGVFVGIALGGLSSFLQDSPILQIGTLETLKPSNEALNLKSSVDFAGSVQSSASLMHGAAQVGNGSFNSGVVLPFIGFGSERGLSAIWVPVGFMSNVIMEGGIIPLTASYAVRADQLNILEFGDALVFVAGAVPGAGLALLVMELSYPEAFKDMKNALNQAFDMPQA